ncbi:hypothetical protein [Actibacterium ureilyticum]|nr:hypothetical protein [Actibacterium ureilyticum]
MTRIDDIRRALDDGRPVVSDKLGVLRAQVNALKPHFPDPEPEVADHA